VGLKLCASCQASYVFSAQVRFIVKHVLFAMVCKMTASCCFLWYRRVWNSLADMSSNDARRKFIEMLDQKVPVFGPYMIAHQKEKEEKERKR